MSASKSGAEEYFSCVLDLGIYYFAILGASGNGMYVLDFFENVQYIDEEINDSISTAQIIGTESGFSGGSVTGIIDTMRDADYYKINVTYAPVLVKVDFSAPGNNTFVWIESESSAEMLSYNNNMFILAPGTHYFAVYDASREFYIGNGTYTVSIEVISGNLTKDMKATAYSYLPAYDIIIQFYPDRTRYYINGKYINLSCSYSGNIGSNVNSSQYKRWMISLNSGKSLIYNLKEVRMDYQSVLENKRVSKVYILEIGTTDGQTTFGSQYIQTSTVSSNMNINYAIVAIDAFDGTVTDILTPDPNPFDRYDYSIG